MHLFYQLSSENIFNLAILVTETTGIVLENKINGTNLPINRKLTDGKMYQKFLRYLKDEKENDLSTTALLYFIIEQLNLVMPYTKSINSQIQLEFSTEDNSNLKMHFSLIGQYYRLLKNRKDYFACLEMSIESKDDKKHLTAVLNILFERCNSIREQVAHDFSQKTPLKQTGFSNKDCFDLLTKFNRLLPQINLNRVSPNSPTSPKTTPS